MRRRGALGATRRAGGAPSSGRVHPQRCGHRCDGAGGPRKEQRRRDGGGRHTAAACRGQRRAVGAEAEAPVLSVIMMEGGGGVADGGGGCGLRQYFSWPYARALKPGGRPEGRCRRQSSGVSAHGSGALAPPLPASACPSRPRGDGRARRPALFVPPRGSGRARSGHRTAPPMAVRWQIRSSGSAAERQRERARGRRAAPLPWASVGGFRCREFGQCGVPRRGGGSRGGDA